MSDNYPQKDLAPPMKLGDIEGSTAVESPEEGHDLEENAPEEAPEDTTGAVVVPSESAISFESAMEAAGSGGKVRRSGWANSHAYVTDSGNGLEVVLPRKHTDHRGPYDAGPVDRNSNDWVIIE